MVGGGEPGGEGGISKFGTGGIVRSRNSARLAEYGERGVASSGSSGRGDAVESAAVGPRAGPTIGASG